VSQSATTPRAALIILDGFGLSAHTKGNAVHEAKLPVLTELIRTHPTTSLAAAGTEVGLEWGEVGNSEVGHFNIGAGRVVLQDLPRINAAIKEGRFGTNAALQAAVVEVKKQRSVLHLVGLVSNGGVHGHLDHLVALLEFAKAQQVTSVVVHAITDGRDTPPKVAQKFLGTLVGAIDRIGVGRLGTIVGRQFAMDRDRHWDRTERAYRALVDRAGEPIGAFETVMARAYAAKQSDETLEPRLDPAIPGIKTGDVVICANYRPDRARQLMQALTDPEFAGFKRPAVPSVSFVSFTNYGQEASSRVRVAFFAEPVPHALAAEVATHDRGQLHVAETEKYAHVTYFLNAGREEPFPGEERSLVPSPRVGAFDEKPAMSAETVARTFLAKFTPAVSFGVLNFANPDMVGHTGNLRATVRALETIDQLIGSLVSRLTADGVPVVITADHGNAEQLIHPITGEIDKEHTVNPVPLILVRPGAAVPRAMSLATLAAADPVGVLADVAPTMLELLELPVPGAMTGQSLVHAL
jgi:2,3-bisphosphoglycerate-independent phosphoglycerate mutase